MAKMTTEASGSGSSKDPETLLNTYWSYMNILGDSNSREENKLKAVQDLSGDLEFQTIVSNAQYPAFLDHALQMCLKILEDTEPQFLSQQNVTQQLRKHILEIIHHIPTNKHLEPYVKSVLSLMFKLLEVDNEENVLVCLRIIIELHKTFRPKFSSEIQQFLKFVKNIYKTLPKHLESIFEPSQPVQLPDLTPQTLDMILEKTFTVTSIQVVGSPVKYNLLPRAILSLKVLAELPIIVVLMYKLYEQDVFQDVADFIPIIMVTITLQPSDEHRSSPNFNREVFVDFMAAQIKTLTFLAYIVKIYQNIVGAHSDNLTRGILGLLSLCPPEVAHLRKDLLIAARHILATELREKFVDSLDLLLDETILIGTGWTAHESLRPLAYSTLADLVHHVRQSLSLKDLSKAVTVFSKNIHDDSLMTTIQTMSCKLLLNLVECIQSRSEQENGNGREILMRMLEIFVLKFKTFAKLQLPVLAAKCRQHQNSAHNSQSQESTSTNSQSLGSSEDLRDIINMPIGSWFESQEEKVKYGFPVTQTSNYSLSDCCSLVKTLICGVKTITWGISTCKVPGESNQNKQFEPKETLVFIRLLKYAFQSLDVYTLSAHGVSRTLGGQASKEEKDVLEHLAGVFSMMNPFTFREVFASTIEYTVHRIYTNSSLQLVANTFLVNPTTSPIFATILVEYLLKRMKDMGANTEYSNLYLNLFKLVFAAYSLFPSENAQMLKPRIHQIVNQSLKLAQSAKEPMNYLMLLHALFESIAGDNPLIDLLYQEFLPLLPNLLQGLNNLMHGSYKHHTKDLVIELCLTVPVRLSSLLPYMSMVMAPLVAALNGSEALVSLGLETLDKLSDALQPDFLSDHIFPVEAELMQALWRTLRSPNDNLAQVAFHVLGKFGGINRKMIAEPQTLVYERGTGPCISVKFIDYNEEISLPIGKVVEAAFEALKSSATTLFYKMQCWEVIKGFFAANIDHANIEGDSAYKLQSNLKHIFSSIQVNESILHCMQHVPYKCRDEESRRIHEIALTAMLVASTVKELNQNVQKFVVFVIQHYSLLMVEHQYGVFVSGHVQNNLNGMDPLVLIDATATLLGHEHQEFSQVGSFGLILMIDTMAICVSSKSKASQLYAFEYLVKRMCALCYERPWYSKLGGCVAIRTLMEWMPPKCVFEHMYTFLKAFLFVMVDLDGDVSSGAVDMAKKNLEEMLSTYCVPVTPSFENSELVELQDKAISDAIQEFIQRLNSPNTCLREQAMHSLHIIAKVSEKSVVDVIEPHSHLLEDISPPWKHELCHLPVSSQIALLDGHTFCISLKPTLFDIDFRDPAHLKLLEELITLCDSDDNDLRKIPCYKNVLDLTLMRKAALKFLAACHYMDPKRIDIFNALFRTISCTNVELQTTAFEGMKQMISDPPLDADMICSALYPVLVNMSETEYLTLHIVRQLEFLTQLFPSCFNEALCEQFLLQLKKYLQIAIDIIRSNRRSHNEIASKEIEGSAVDMLKICTSIINMFHQIPQASSKLIEPMIALALNAEKHLVMEVSSPFREPLVKFLQHFPRETTELFLQESQMQDDQASRFLDYLLRDDKGLPFRQFLQQNPEALINLAQQLSDASNMSEEKLESSNLALVALHTIRYHFIQVVSILVKYDDNWLAGQHQLIVHLRSIWISNEFQNYHLKADLVDFTQWKEPKLLAKCLLNYVRHHPEDIELLFQLLRAFTGRFIPDFNFLADYLKNTVATQHSVEWKKMAFFQFVEIFSDNSYPANLKAMVMRWILIPSSASVFEKGEGDRLLENYPAPHHDKNVMTIFINNVIDSNNIFGTPDAIRISLLQFSCLFLEHAAQHVHDGANKNQCDKLKKLMTFAWPCLSGVSCVDPATKYNSHLLLAHIIAKFAIHRRIVLQVFRSLLKAHAPEARTVVRQALDILTPAVPVRMEDGMLTHWTMKVIVEEGHTLAQLVHVLQLLVRHFKVYYKVRHDLIHHIVSSIQRLVFTANATFEHKRLAVDLAEVVIRWEIMFTKGVQDSEVEHMSPVRIEIQETKKGKSVASSANDADHCKKFDKTHSDAVVNFLLRMACQASESSGTANLSNEGLSQRCVCLLKTALKPDIWQNSDLELSWFDKLLIKEEDQQPSFTNICTALDLLSFLLVHLKKDTILAMFQHLQSGITACVTHNSKVVRTIHNKLSQLLCFPKNSEFSKVLNDHMICLYEAINTVVCDVLKSCEDTSVSLSSLFGTLMLLKAMCVDKPENLDRHLTMFMTCFQKLTSEHLNAASQDNNTITTDLLLLCIDLVKTRIHIMSASMRKSFMMSTLVDLIEKSPEVKVMKALTKMVSDWVCKGEANHQQTLSDEEQSCLFVKLLQFTEKNFGDDNDLNIQFLELIHYVYKERLSKSMEDNAFLQSHLFPAFMTGLQCVQPEVREKFFNVFCEIITSNGQFTEYGQIYQRLMYVVCCQNWEPVGSHYRIKQWIELLFTTVNIGTNVKCNMPGVILPALTSVLTFMEQNSRDSFERAAMSVKDEPMDTDEDSQDDPQVTVVSEGLGLHQDGLKFSAEKLTMSTDEPYQAPLTVRALIPKQLDFLQKLCDVKTADFLKALCQLCHMDAALAEHVWLHLFPRVWKIMPDEQRQDIEQEMVPFLFNSSHLSQKGYHLNSYIGTLAQSMTCCEPKIQFEPPLLQYLGKSYNLWHQSCLLLEDLLLENNVIMQFQDLSVKGSESGEEYKYKLLMNTIADMYEQLKEEDLWCGLWLKRAKFPKTTIAVALEQHGFFEQAQEAFKDAITTSYEDSEFEDTLYAQSEFRLWKEHWIRCTKELNEWDIVLDFAASKEGCNPYLVLENVWRIPRWPQMKSVIDHIESNCPRESAWKVNLYKGYLNICDPESGQSNNTERLVEVASTLCIREWRKLPHIVSNIHIPILQASQQIMELQDASLIHQGLLPNNVGQQSSLQEMRSIVETWKNRIPLLSDKLSYWSEVLLWRQLHYQAIMAIYSGSGLDEQGNDLSGHGKSAAHALAQSIIHLGRIARKHEQPTVCLKALEKIDEIPSIRISDGYQKFRQKIKSHMQLAHKIKILSSEKALSAFGAALNSLEATNTADYTKEMNAEFHTIKAALLFESGNAQLCNREYVTAVGYHSSVAKSWTAWASFLEKMFLKDPVESRQVPSGIFAVSNYLIACRYQTECKSRDILAKVLWLLTYDDDDLNIFKTFEEYCTTIPPAHWLSWIPQLLTWLVQVKTGQYIVSLLEHVGRVYPQAIFFQLRTLFLLYKSEPQATSPDANLWYSNVIHMLMNHHPTVLTCLEEIVDQMECFSENWYEEVYRLLSNALMLCFNAAFGQGQAIATIDVPPSICAMLTSMVTTYGLNYESSPASKQFIAADHDYIFHRIKASLIEEFNFREPMKMNTLIAALKRWVKMLSSKIKMLPKTFIIDEKCKFLSNFSPNIADIKMPGEFLEPSHNHTYVKITRFIPKVDIVQKHNTLARRIYIQGHNGKVYTYLVVNRMCYGDTRHEERVYQLLRMMNKYLHKNKETAKRFLHFSVPHMVSLSPTMCLIRDNESTLSLLDIYSQHCEKNDKDTDDPLIHYYKRMGEFLLSKNREMTHNEVLTIFKEVQRTMCPNNVLRTWAQMTYPSPTDYWSFRKQFALNIALIGLAEYALHLIELNPEMLIVRQDSGLLNISNSRFSLDDATGELDANSSVPCRLSPNLFEFINFIGVSGPVVATMIAASRALLHPSANTQAILKAVLRDEIIAWYRKRHRELHPEDMLQDIDGTVLVHMVTNSTQKILKRFLALTIFNGADSKASHLTKIASTYGNLCRMNPTYHPWL